MSFRRLQQGEFRCASDVFNQSRRTKARSKSRWPNTTIPKALKTINNNDVPELIQTSAPHVIQSHIGYTMTHVLKTAATAYNSMIHTSDLDDSVIGKEMLLSGE